MIDKFDYLEPACPLSGGREFYDPKESDPLGRIPVGRVLEKADSLFDKNDYPAAGRLLDYWRAEALALQDRRGLLSIDSELVGYCRKTGDRDRALALAAEAEALVEELGQGDLASGATVLLNCATAYKAFGMAQEALPLYRRAQAVYEKTLGPGDARFGGLYNNMALALADLGRYGEAEQAYLGALRVMEQVPRGEAEAAITYLNMAYLYEASGEGEKIGPCLDRAYWLLQSEHLPRNGHYAFVLEKCAPAFTHFGDRATGERMKKESEAIYAGT